MVGGPSPARAEEVAMAADTAVVDMTAVIAGAAEKVVQPIAPPSRASSSPQTEREQILPPVSESLTGRATAVEFANPENGWVRDLEARVPTVEGDKSETLVSLAPHSFAKCEFSAGTVLVGDGFKVTFSNRGTLAWKINDTEVQSGYVFKVNGVIMELVIEGNFGYLVLSNQGESEVKVNLVRTKSDVGLINLPAVGARIPAENMDLLKSLGGSGLSYEVEKVGIVRRLFRRGAPNAMNLETENGCRVSVPRGETLVLGRDVVKITTDSENGVSAVFGGRIFTLSRDKAMQCGSIVFGYEEEDGGYLFYIANEGGKEGGPFSVKVEGKKIKVV